MKSIVLLWMAAFALHGQPVEIRVDAASTLGPFKPIYAYFGYDEPNYTYMPNGRKLIGELARAQPRARLDPHASPAGDGRRHAGAQMGLDQRLHRGRRRQAGLRLDHRGPHLRHLHAGEGAKPFVEIGFMPEALSTNPEPYARQLARRATTATGWAYPPKDYAKWAELVRQWVLHAVARYGKAEVESWYWELWNEPDISYWRGTPEEYDKLYDYTADAVKRALPAARVGGPAHAREPAVPKAAAFLKQFLEHCARGTNAATGKAGAPLDFISYHAKGRRSVVDGHVRMGLAKEMVDVQTRHGDRPRVSAVSRAAHRAERVRSGRLRRLFGARLSRRTSTATARCIPATRRPR